MIPSPNRSSRNRAQVKLVVVHTAEGARTVAALGDYFANPAVQASSHVGIDDTGAVEQYVPYTDAAWTIRSANAVSDNAELCGFAAWTREQWLTEHAVMLSATAAWIRERCTARGIPIRKLNPAQVAAGQPGVIGHVDWTLGMHDGSHTDPGPNFPWDHVIDLAQRGVPAPTVQEADLTKEEHDMLALLVSQMVTGPDPNKWGWGTFAGGTNEILTVVDYLRRTNQQLTALTTQLNAIETGKAPAPGAAVAGLSEADKDDIARRVAALLGSRISAS